MGGGGGAWRYGGGVLLAIGILGRRSRYETCCMESREV